MSLVGMGCLEVCSFHIGIANLNFRQVVTARVCLTVAIGTKAELFETYFRYHARYRVAIGVLRTQITIAVLLNLVRNFTADCVGAYR